MNFTPAASRSVRFEADSMPASAATTITVSTRPYRCWNWRTVASDGGGLGVVAFETSDFQGESGAIDEQARPRSANMQVTKPSIDLPTDNVLTRVRRHLGLQRT